MGHAGGGGGGGGTNWTEHTALPPSNVIECRSACMCKSSPMQSQMSLDMGVVTSLLTMTG